MSSTNIEQSGFYNKLNTLYTNIKNQLHITSKLKINQENSSLDPEILINNIQKIFIDLIAEKNSFEKKIEEQSSYLRQLENHIKKLEFDIRIFIRKEFQFKFEKISTDLKIEAYKAMQEEYEYFKSEFKFENGRFLDNEKKENEIIILRQENTLLKKEITRLENTNKIIDSKLQSNDKVITELTKQLDKIIQEKEKENKENNDNKDNKDNNNIVNKNNRNVLSKLTIKQDSNMPHAIHFNSINNKHIKNKKKINNLLNNNFNRKKNNYSNFHILKGLYISENKKKPNNVNSNNTNHQMLSNNSNGSNKKKTINTNTIDSIIFFTTYNKINNMNSNRHKSNPKKNSNIALYRKRYKSNPSISMKIDEDKTDYFFRCLNNCGVKYNTGVKNSRFLKIMNMIPNSKFPLSTKQMYAKHHNHLSLAKKSCHNNSNDLMKNINNHSSLNLRSGIKD